MKKFTKITLSVSFIVLTAFVTHYFFVSRMAEKDREVASFGERSSTGQIQWEQRLAQDLSEGDMRTQKPTQVSWQDVLVYEFLRGQYSITVKQGHIERIVLQDQQDGFAIDAKQFIETYGPKIKNYAQYEIKQVDEKSTVIQLRDQQGQSAGSFMFNKNDQGKVTEILVQ